MANEWPTYEPVLLRGPPYQPVALLRGPASDAVLIMLS
jgi:hypothetical protein